MPSNRRLPALVPITNSSPASVVGGAASVGSGQTVAQYALYVRDSSRRLVGQIDQFDQFQAVLRFNAIGNWTLDVDASHPMAGALATRGNGLVVNRIITDAVTGAVVSSTVLLSGPIRGWQRQKQGNTLTVNGLDDLCWVAMRDAYPLATFPYASTILADVPKRYYRLGEASGTTATDSSTSAQNGTYSASGVTYSVWPGGIDDTNTAVTLDGVNGWVNVPGTGLPAANTPWTLEVWCKFAAYPASTDNLLTLGTAATNQAAALVLTTTGNLQCTIQGVISAVAGTSVTTGVWHHLVATWDGTTLATYLDGIAGGTQTPAALAITLGSAAIGANIGGTSGNFAGSVDEAAIYSTALSAARVTAHYQTGVSRFAAGYADTRTGTAETVIRQYVNVNCINAANDPLGLSRVVSGLSLAADGAHGSSVTGNARFDALLTKDGTGLLQTLALASNPRLGFKVAQSGTNLIFSVYVPSDKTGSIIFSEALGNLADFTYQLQAPDIEAGGNVTMVGGGGQGTLREFLERADTSAITTWGRTEMFSDARDTTDVPTLQQRGDADLAQNSEQVSFSAVLAPNQSMVFGKDFNLGDKVTVVVDGVAFQDIVREVAITLDTQAGETVTPAIGTPFNASPKDALAALASRIRRTNAQTAKLQRAQ